MTTNRKVTLPDVIDSAITSRLSDTYHALPAIVQKYYDADMEADVQIAVNDPRFDPDTDKVSTEEWPVYPHVRVAWPRFGGLTIIGHLNAGDKVQVFFQDLDDSNFRVTGQQGDPSRTRRFGSDGAFVVPWDLTDGGRAADASATTSNQMVVGADGDQAQIRIKAGTIQLGASGGDSVALDNKVKTAFANFATWVLSLSNGGGTLTGGPPPTDDVGSSLVKAQ